MFDTKYKTNLDPDPGLVTENPDPEPSGALNRFSKI